MQHFFFEDQRSPTTNDLTENFSSKLWLYNKIIRGYEKLLITKESNDRKQSSKQIR